MKDKDVLRSNLNKLGYSAVLVIINRFFITLIAFFTLGVNNTYQSLNLRVLGQVLIGCFTRYDSGWYVNIAQNGYYNMKSSAFFPLYPLLMRGVSFVTGLHYRTSGMLISVICFFVSLYLIQILCEQPGVLRFTGNNKHAGKWIAAILAFSPVSFFFTIPYTESLFLMISLLFMIAVMKKRWLAAGLLGLVAGITRNSGVLLAIIFMFEYVRSVLPPCSEGKFLDRCHFYLVSLRQLIKEQGLRIVIKYRSFFLIILIPVGLIVYFIYLYYRFGSFTAPIKSQDQFGRDSMFPLLTLYHGFQFNLDKVLENQQYFFFHYYFLEITSVLFFIFAIFYLINKVPLSFNLFMIASLILPLCKPAYVEVVDYFVSFPRYTLTLFPYYAAVYGVLRGTKLGKTAYLIISALLLYFSVSFWVIGKFIA